MVDQNLKTVSQESFVSALVIYHLLLYISVLDVT